MTRRIYIVLPTIAAILFARSGAPASAADPDLPPPDPPFHWRYVTQDPATTSSQCIGDPRTPECVVDTIEACFTRWDDALCDKVAMSMNYRSKRSSTRFSRYRIVSSRRLRDVDIPAHHRNDGKWSWKPGDVQVTVHWVRCLDDGCWPGFTLTTFTMRKVGDIWAYVYRDTPRRQ